MSDRNAVTNTVTQEGETHSVTPPHTTPHHTTKEATSARTDALALPARVRISEINPWDALTRLVCWLRPDWQPERVRATLLDDHRAPATLLPAAIAAALDPDIRQPGGIRHHRAPGAHGPTPTPPGRDEECPRHPGWVRDHCGGCRADAIAGGTR
jgi:hypothetical protein